MWHEPIHRIALLELLQIGKLKKRAGQAAAWQELLTLGWARRAGRQDELEVVPSYKPVLEQTLDHCWSDWRDHQGELLHQGLPPTEHGLRALESRRRAKRAKGFPQRLNHRTAAAALAAHSKARLGETERALLGTSELTTDYLIRLRGCCGLMLHRDRGAYDAAALERLQGELILSERALLDGTVLSGSPRAILLVENVGVFVDLHPPPGWLLAHVPGWNTQGARRLVTMLPDPPVLHFGDLDPEGMEIFFHLREHQPSLRWVVLDWFTDYLPTHGQAIDWPKTASLAQAPALIRELARQSRWLEQETLVLDDRLWPSLWKMAEPPI